MINPKTAVVDSGFGGYDVSHLCDCRLVSYITDDFEETKQNYSEVLSSKEMIYFDWNGKSVEKIDAHRLVIKCRRCNKVFIAVVCESGGRMAYLHEDGTKLEVEN